MKKKRQHKSKYSVKKRKRYQAGGSMYADNTVQSAGQGAVGTTANTRFNSNFESIPTTVNGLTVTNNSSVPTTSAGTNVYGFTNLDSK